MSAGPLPANRGHRISKPAAGIVGATINLRDKDNRETDMAYERFFPDTFSEYKGPENTGGDYTVDPGDSAPEIGDYTSEGGDYTSEPGGLVG